MPDKEGDQSQEKTEEPSGRRKDQYREEGQVAKSAEISAVTTIVSSIALLSIMGTRFASDLALAIQGAFQLIAQPGPGAARIWMMQFVVPTMITVGVFAFSLFCLILLVSIFQTGILISWKSLMPKVDNISPISGVKRFLSPKMLVMTGKSMLKVCVIGTIVYTEMSTKMESILALADLPLIEAALWGAGLIAKLILKISIFLAVVALFDYLYQWYSMNQKMRMSKQELKEEMKETQVSDHVRSKVRQVAQERAKQTIQKEVPTADVIITNPTHYAVAIRYKRGVDMAPRLVAKGKNQLALMIKKVAEEHDVPLYEFPELARKLYRKVRVGHIIDEEMYESVARVLAYIYHLYQQRHTLSEGQHYA